MIMDMMSAQGFVKDATGIFQVPQDKNISMQIPANLIPKCPDDGRDMTMNLRSDNSFVEDDGWKKASVAYSEFIAKYKNEHILFLELGVGMNTPIIIKFPFWQMTAQNPKAIYTCLNYNQAYCPKEIEEQSVCINDDIFNVLQKI